MWWNLLQGNIWSGNEPSWKLSYLFLSWSSRNCNSSFSAELSSAGVAASVKQTDLRKMSREKEKIAICFCVIRQLSSHRRKCLSLLARCYSGCLLCFLGGEQGLHSVSVSAPGLGCSLFFRSSMELINLCISCSCSSLGGKCTYSSVLWLNPFLPSQQGHQRY